MFSLRLLVFFSTLRGKALKDGFALHIYNFPHSCTLHSGHVNTLKNSPATLATVIYRGQSSP